MEYTHTLIRNRGFTPSEWDEIVSGTKKLIKEARKEVVIGYNDVTSYIDIESEEFEDEVFYSVEEREECAAYNAIDFNGSTTKREDYEEFYLTDVLTKSSAKTISCETNKQPYDALVCALLLLIKKIVPDVKIESGGSFYNKHDNGYGVGDTEWHKAAKLLLNTFPQETFYVPMSIWIDAGEILPIPGSEKNQLGQHHRGWPITRENLLDTNIVSWQPQVNVSFLETLMADVQPITGILI